MSAGALPISRVPSDETHLAAVNRVTILRSVLTRGSITRWKISYCESEKIERGRDRCACTYVGQSRPWPSTRNETQQVVIARESSTAAVYIGPGSPQQIFSTLPPYRYGRHYNCIDVNSNVFFFFFFLSTLVFHANTSTIETTSYRQNKTVSCDSGASRTSIVQIVFFASLLISFEKFFEKILKKIIFLQYSTF